MTARSIRRAAERRAKKLARKAERLAAAEVTTTNLCDSEPVEAAATIPELLATQTGACPAPTANTQAPRPAATISAAQLAANRANARLSSGPRTAAGKASSSLNAVTTGLTGRTVLLPTDDPAEYERHMQAYQKEFAPIGQVETDLVRSIAEIAWRLKRIPSLEASIYAIGHAQLAEEFEDCDPEVRPNLIQLAVHLKYEKQIRNLQLQESRLVRRREKEIAELRRIQAERKTAESQHPQRTDAQGGPSKTLPQNGFEFSASPNQPSGQSCPTLGDPGFAAKAA